MMQSLSIFGWIMAWVIVWIIAVPVAAQQIYLKRDDDASMYACIAGTIVGLACGFETYFVWFT